MTRPPRYALIGATRIGAYHLAAIRAMEKDGLAHLNAVVDPVLANVSELRTNLETDGVRCYLDHREMLREESALDVIVIATPIPFHLQMTLDCLDRDAFIYLEKPPVPLVQQWEAMRAADKHQRIGVGFQMISSSWVQKLKTAIIEGKLGRVREIRIGACWPRMDRYYQRNTAAGKMSHGGEPIFDGPATNAMAHLIHNAMFLASEQPGQYAAPVEITAELYRARPIESYDVACLRGRFASGVTFSAALTHATEEAWPYRFEVRGTGGWARVTEDSTVIESSSAPDVHAAETAEHLVEKTHRQFAAFACGDEARPLTSLPDTRGYILATNGMLLSSGMIHSIEDRYRRRYQHGSEGGYDVAGLRSAVEASFETGKLFSELGLPWARSTSPVSVETLKTFALSDFDRDKSVGDPQQGLPHEFAPTPHG